MSDFGLMGRPEHGSEESEEQDELDDLHERDESGDDATRQPGRRRGEPEPRKRRGWIAALVILLLLAGGVTVAGKYGFDKLKEHFADAPDYAGPGSGSVLFQVKEGDNVAVMGRGLRADDVVRSVDSFVDAARKDDRSSTIQVGYYRMKKHMRSADALKVLVNPRNIIQTAVTVPEGARVKSIVDTIVKRTPIRRAALQRELANPSRIGLPASAEGNPEGYLYPATYAVPPRTDARTLLRQMVAKTVSVEKDLNLGAKAAQRGLSPEQVLTMASILEYEASRDEDYPKVARAIYNRLDIDMPLQSDATVAYANGKSGSLYTTAQERRIDSPYNTYTNPGLPPGPIGSPGVKTIEAVLNPSSGDQLYWVVVNLRTGETKYAKTFKEHLANVEEFRTYCKTSDAC